MPVVPTMLPDTASKAGYSELDPISQWFLGGSGTAGAQANGLNDDIRYGLDLQNVGSGGLGLRTTSGNNTYQFKNDNTGNTFVGGFNVTGASTFSSPVTLLSTLAVTGIATFSTTEPGQPCIRMPP